LVGGKNVKPITGNSTKPLAETLQVAASIILQASLLDTNCL